jgi:hypothetical protein
MLTITPERITAALGGPPPQTHPDPLLPLPADLPLLLLLVGLPLHLLRKKQQLSARPLRFVKPLLFANVL